MKTQENYLRANGEWSKIDFDWSDTDVTRALKAAGYREYPQVFGDHESADYPSDWYIELWCADDDKAGVPAPYYVVLSTYNRLFSAFAETFGCAFDLIAKWLPIVETCRRMEFMATAEEAIKRFFEAWHGHEFGRPCEECDREGVRAKEIRRQTRLAKKLNPA